MAPEAAIVNLDIVFAGRHSVASEAIKSALERLTGVRTVPQTFLGGRFVGGGDEIMQAFESGALQTQIESSALTAPTGQQPAAATVAPAIRVEAFSDLA